MNLAHQRLLSLTSIFLKKEEGVSLAADAQRWDGRREPSTHSPQSGGS